MIPKWSWLATELTDPLGPTLGIRCNKGVPYVDRGSHIPLGSLLFFSAVYVASKVQHFKEVHFDSVVV